MDIPQKPYSTIFVDYIPAELRENKTWEIVYYVKNPISEKLERKRNRVRPCKSITERRKLAKRMIKEINNKLETDLLSFFNKTGVKEFTKLYDAVRIYLTQTLREVKDRNLSEDTYRTYKSRIDNIQHFIEMKEKTDMLCNKFDTEFINEFLDYLRYEKGLSARTRDNYFTFITTFTGWMSKKKYISVNPCEDISKINKRLKRK